MNNITELFCEIDDFCQDLEPQIETFESHLTPFSNWQ